MESAAKINLSDAELLFVQDKQFILAKQHIISVVYDLFSQLVKNLQPVIQTDEIKLPIEMLYAVPKIYKGEHYNNFPYVMLDYPAIFNKEGSIAIRHMFWWSNFFSVTLHVSGRFKKEYEESIIKNAGRNKEGLYLCINDTEWQHHFEEDNYVLMSSVPAGEFAAISGRQSFLKIALQYPLSDWKNMLFNLENGSLKLLKLFAV